MLCELELELELGNGKDIHGDDDCVPSCILTKYLQVGDRNQ